MQRLVVYARDRITALIKKRKGETKFGERVQTLTSGQFVHEQLIRSNAEYVLLGIPENIGIKANGGTPGTTAVWQATLEELLNTQHSKHNRANKFMILGHLDFGDMIEKIDSYDFSNSIQFEETHKMVEEIDREVSHIIYQIISAGKKAIIIGGGHNNAYGNIKGTALANNKPINAVNVDVQADFKSRDGRNSENSFTYAMAEGFLDRYFVFGLHENYTSKNVFDRMDKFQDRVQFDTYEELMIRHEKSFSHRMKAGLDFVSKNKFGIEIDCNAIESAPSSTMGPSGFSVAQARQFVSFFSRHKNAAYLHLCEATLNENDPIQGQQVGKLLSYLITDFIRK